METQWNFTGMGAMIGWNFGPALDLLINGYKLKGEELLAETERLKILELSQMEIENKKRKREKALADAKKRSGVPDDGDTEHIEGDLDDFMVED